MQKISKIRNLPVHLQILIAAIPSLIVIAIFIFLVFLPKNDDLKVLKTKMHKLDKEITSSEAKIKRLDSLIAENTVLKDRLLRLQQQLPEEKEVSVLLKQISELGLRSGLEILLWKPEARKTDPAGLYVEIPVNVEVLAEYHKLGVFFSHISRLPRLVNISNIKLSSKASTGRGNMGDINASFTALTFASAGPKDIPPAPAGKVK